MVGGLLGKQIRLEWWTFDNWWLFSAAFSKTSSLQATTPKTCCQPWRAMWRLCSCAASSWACSSGAGNPYLPDLVLRFWLGCAAEEEEGWTEGGGRGAGGGVNLKSWGSHLKLTSTSCFGWWNLPTCRTSPSSTPCATGTTRWTSCQPKGSLLWQSCPSNYGCSPRLGRPFPFWQAHAKEKRDGPEGAQQAREEGEPQQLQCCCCSEEANPGSLHLVPGHEEARQGNTW